MSRGPLQIVAGWLGRGKRVQRLERDLDRPRILLIRRNRMGDMICTLPLIHALRRHYPRAHLAVACDAGGEPIARASAAVDQVILLASGGIRALTLRRNVRRLQGFDWVIVAKGGFDRRLARLAKLSRAGLRIGFSPRAGGKVAEYTDPVTPPENGKEHQIETLLRLLAPLGIKRVSPLAGQLRLEVPEEAKKFARTRLAEPGLAKLGGLILINLSSTSPLRFRAEDFLELAGRIVAGTDRGVGFVGAPADQERAAAMAGQAGSTRVVSLATPGPLELAALLERSVLFITPEGGAAHLAAAVGTPAVVLWSEGPFEKWHSRGERHVFVRAEGREKRIPVGRVWEAVLKSLIF